MKLIINYSSCAAVVALVAACMNAGTPVPARTSSAITAADAKYRIYAIADDSMKGRDAGGVGNFMMTSYIAREMARLRLEPGGENGTWFQTIPMIRRYADSSSTLSAGGHALALFTDFVPVRPTTTLRLGTTLRRSGVPVVYGGRLGDSSAMLRQSDITGQLIVFDAPTGANGMPTGVYATPMTISADRFRGAAAIVVAALDIVTPATAMSLRSRGAGLIGQDQSSSVSPMGLVVTRAAAELMTGAPLATLQPGATGVTANANISFVDKRVDALARNVVAIVRGSDRALRGEYVAIGAHAGFVRDVAIGVANRDDRVRVDKPKPNRLAACRQ